MYEQTTGFFIRHAVESTRRLSFRIRVTLTDYGRFFLKIFPFIVVGFKATRRRPLFTVDLYYIHIYLYICIYTSPQRRRYRRRGIFVWALHGGRYTSLGAFDIGYDDDVCGRQIYRSYSRYVYRVRAIISSSCLSSSPFIFTKMSALVYLCTFNVRRVRMR